MCSLFHRSKTMTLFAAPFIGGSCSHRLKHLHKRFGRGFWFRDLEAVESGAEHFPSPREGKKLQTVIMDVSVQYAGPVKEGLISGNDWGHLWRNCNQGSSNVGSLVAELGIALEDALVLLSTSASAPPLAKEDEFEELIIDQDQSLIGMPQNDFGEHVGLPCSQNILLCDVPVSGEDKTSNTALDGQSCLKPGNLTSASIMSLPVVSSMKGGREKRGLHIEKLSVRWAPDVYDPTPTSQSHTVKSHKQHCPKMSKKSNRRKHKGKSPRSNSTDKKQRHKS